MALVDLPRSAIDSVNILDLEFFKSYQFGVQIDGMTEAAKFVLGFHEISGIEDKLNVREIAELGNRAPYRFPRKIQPSEVRMRRGMGFSRALWNWYLDCKNWLPGRPSYLRTVSIFLIDRINTPAGIVDYEGWRWDLIDAWPSEWIGPRLNSMSEALAFEEITLQHQGIIATPGIFSGKAGEALGVFA